MRNVFDKTTGFFDEARKTLVINSPKEYFVPSYAYYLCEFYQGKYGYEIEYIEFSNPNNNLYKIEKLKGVRDWDDTTNE